jgi:hypothetical protein
MELFVFHFLGSGPNFLFFISQMKTRKRHISIMEVVFESELLFLLFKTKPKQIQVFTHA